ECAICCNRFYKPTTTPCGHTFCRPCLLRSVDHQRSCPFCRQPVKTVDKPCQMLCDWLGLFFDDDQDREMDMQLEQDEDTVPILIGSLAFPHVRCVIHIFEPRYRLMLRRVMQSCRRRFAMCLVQRSSAGDGEPFAEYGTMLELTHVQTLVDGRSIVEAIGSHRFRISSHSVVDGYHVGQVERIDDIPEEQEQARERQQILSASAARARQQQQQQQQQQQVQHRPYMTGMLGTHRPSWAAQAHPQTQNPTVRSPWLQMHVQGLSYQQAKPKSTALASSSASALAKPAQSQVASSSTVNREEQSTDDLLDDLASFIDRLISQQIPNTNDRFSQWLAAMGDPPISRGPRRDRVILTWWIANMMPLDENEKLKLLSMRSLRERVLTITAWVDRFQDQWAYFFNSQS
ncbi:PUA-like domain-containing protein, partial [Radiomyces spectabilis]|uniref:PUA-like domain-containing protein n=1 Tax=Radiomyces spectabilis TaxID=64574 RepID=UPI00221FC124